MKNSKITRKITQGMYILTTHGGGCVIDAVSRASAGDQPLITIAVSKTNHSHKLLQDNQRFALSVLGENANPEVIQVFGFNSSKDVDKFKHVDTVMIKEVPVLKESIGYMVCEKVDAIDMETHTLYVGRMIEGDILDNDKPMSYAYYQEHKGDLVKTTTANNQTAWVCTACGYVYYGEEIPDDYKCPLCGLGKEFFKKRV